MWQEFFRLYPFDDMHRYHRPAAAVAATFGGDFRKVLEVLSPDPTPPDLSTVDVEVMKAFGVKPGARG